MNRFGCEQTTLARRSEQGMVLVMALLILLAMSIMIMGYSSDVEMDLYISRNLQLKHQSFNWAETGLDFAQEIVGYSVDTRGDEPESILVESYYNVSLSNGTLPLYTADFDSPGFIEFCEGNCTDGTIVSDVTTIFWGSRAAEGGSIVIAAGYEGIGKGVAGAGGFSSYYQLLGRGYERHNSEQAISILYRHVMR